MWLAKKAEPRPCRVALHLNINMSGDEELMEHSQFIISSRGQKIWQWCGMVQEIGSISRTKEIRASEETYKVYVHYRRLSTEVLFKSKSH